MSGVPRGRPADRAGSARHEVVAERVEHGWHQWHEALLRALADHPQQVNRAEFGAGVALHDVVGERAAQLRAAQPRAVREGEHEAQASRRGRVGSASSTRIANAQASFVRLRSA
jgi:hypothetical protein